MRFVHSLFPIAVIASLLSPLPEYPRAFACSYSATFRDFEQATNEEPPTELAAPEPVEFRLLGITRGQGPRPSGCGGTMANSCDDGGAVHLELSRALGEDEGLILETRGSLPTHMMIPTEPATVEDDENVFLRWADEATDDQEAISFEIRVSAIDRWGTTSAPSAWLAIAHPGSD